MIRFLGAGADRQHPRREGGELGFWIHLHRQDLCGPEGDYQSVHSHKLLEVPPERQDGPERPELQALLEAQGEAAEERVVLPHLQHPRQVVRQAVVLAKMERQLKRADGKRLASPKQKSGTPTSAK